MYIVSDLGLLPVPVHVEIITYMHTADRNNSACTEFASKHKKLSYRSKTAR